MTQIPRAALAGLTPAAIVAARRDGRLNAALGMAPADVDLLDRAQTEPLTRADLAGLARLGRHDLIVTAHNDNRTPTEESR